MRIYILRVVLDNLSRNINHLPYVTVVICLCPLRFGCISVGAHVNSTLRPNGVNGSVTLGDGLTQRGRYPGGRKSPSGVQGRRPNSGRTPKLILIFIMDVKLIFYGGKIENAYMSRCFLKRTHAAVLWIHDNRHT